MSLAVLAVPGSIDAQTRPGQAAPKRVTVIGVAYDSLRGTTLPGAYISAQGLPVAAVSDSQGVFRLEQVPAGTHVFAMQHAVLDSLGLSAVTARWSVLDSVNAIRIAVPSLATLWRSACGGAAPARDTGFVYGSVRRPDGRTPAPDVPVEASWVDIINRGAAVGVDIFQRRWTRDTRTDSGGSFTLCGVPVDATVRLAAATDSFASGVIDLIASPGQLVRRKDLVLGGRDSATAPRGVVTGLVSDTTGAPLAGVRVVIDGAAPTRTDEEGRFTVGRVPSGTRQVEFMLVGRLPLSASVDVVANETVSLSAQLRRVNTLDVVRVVGSANAARRVAELEERKRAGLGIIRDSTDIPQFGTPSALYATFPSATVFRTGNGARMFQVTLPAVRGGRCLANVFVDGVRQPDQEMLGILSNDEIAAVELYVRAALAPPQFQAGTGGGGTECGSLVVWTKNAFWR